MKKTIIALCLLLALPMAFQSCSGGADIQPQSTETQTSISDTAETEDDTDEAGGMKKIMVTDAVGKLKITGRYSLTQTGITWDWSASGIEFDADCRGDIVMNYLSEGNVWFRVWIDGEKQDKIYKGVNGNNSTVLAQGLEKGTHRIKVVRMTDVKSSLSIICSLELDGTLCARPADNRYFVEFIGDSLTCGTGNMDGWQGQTEGLGGYRYMDATASFAYLLAEKYIVDCDYSFVSVAGSHLASSTKYENYLDVYPATNYRRSTEVKWEYTRKADLVVVNLGTNDAMQHLDTAEYKTNLGLLIDRIRMNHGNETKIIFVLNMMTNNYIPESREVISARGGEDAGMYSIILAPDSSGAASHPCAEAHRDAAESLAGLIRDKSIIELAVK